MSITIKRVYSGQPGVTQTLLYLCPNSTTARVLKCTASNSIATAATLTVYKLPYPEIDIHAQYLIRPGLEVGWWQVDQCPEVVGQVLNAGDRLMALCSVAGQVSLHLDVMEWT